MGYSSITLNGISLNVKSCNPLRTEKKIKQVMGNSLSQVKIIGMSSKQWNIDYSCIVLGTTQANMDTNRAAIQALDTVTPYALVDGLHDGTYYVQPDSIVFSDSGENANTSYKFTIKLVEQ